MQNKQMRLQLQRLQNQSQNGANNMLTGSKNQDYQGEQEEQEEEQEEQEEAEEGNRFFLTGVAGESRAAEARRNSQDNIQRSSASQNNNQSQKEADDQKQQQYVQLGGAPAIENYQFQQQLSQQQAQQQQEELDQDQDDESPPTPERYNYNANKTDNEKQRQKEEFYQNQAQHHQQLIESSAQHLEGSTYHIQASHQPSIDTTQKGGGPARENSNQKKSISFFHNSSTRKNYPRNSSPGMNPLSGIASIRTPQILNLNKMSADQIAEILEIQRMKDLQRAANNLKNNLHKSGRCPICTLIPPCKHYQRSDDIPAVKKLRLEEQKIKQQERKSPRVFKKKGNSSFQEEPILPIAQNKASMLNKFFKAVNQETRKRQSILQTQMISEGSLLPGLNSGQQTQKSHQTAGTLLPQHQFSQQQQFQTTTPNKVHSQLPPVGSRYSHQKNKQAQSVTRGPNQSMYSGHNLSSLNAGSVVSDGIRGYPPNMKGLRGGSSDEVKVRIRGKGGAYKTQTASVNKTFQQQKETQMIKRQIRKTNQKFQVLNKIQKYREKKIQMQKQQLQIERQRQIAQRQLQQKKEIQRKKYIQKRKKQLIKYQQQKETKQQMQREKQEKQMQKQRQNQLRKYKYHQQQKLRVQDYREKKQMIDEFLKVNQIKSLDDLRRKGQVYMPQGLRIKHQEMQNRHFQDLQAQQYYYNQYQAHLQAQEYEGHQDLPQGMGFVSYPIPEKDSEQKDSLDMLQGGQAPSAGNDSSSREERRYSSLENEIQQKTNSNMPPAETAPLDINNTQ